MSQKERISDCWQFGGGGEYLVRVCGYHRARWTGAEDLPQRWCRCGIYLVEGKVGAAWPGRGSWKQMWAHRGYKLPSTRIFIGYPKLPQDKARLPPNQTEDIEIGLWHQLWHIHVQCEWEMAMDLASGKSLVISAWLTLWNMDGGTRVGGVEGSAGGEEGHPGATNH